MGNLKSLNYKKHSPSPTVFGASSSGALILAGLASAVTVVQRKVPIVPYLHITGIYQATHWLSHTVLWHQLRTEYQYSPHKKQAN